MYYNGYTINVVLLDDAQGVPGSVWHNSDDSYTIFIDATLCADHQKRVFDHEMEHICGNDFDKENVQEIESSAHSI